MLKVAPFKALLSSGLWAPATKKQKRPAQIREHPKL